MAGSPFRFKASFSGGGPNAAITSDGKYLLVSGNNGVTTLVIGSDGVPSLQGQTSLVNNDGAIIALNPTQPFAYVWGQTQNVLSVIRVVDGNTVPVPGGDIYCDNGSLAIDPTGHYLYATGGLDTLVFSIDQTTGLLTQVSSSPAVKGGPSVIVAPSR
ncbi:MAG TPA: hypothetical protein VFQ00_02915 [Terriglobales bacterium]|nr:hypothetical protein [Terriglobales bacterium]